MITTATNEINNSRVMFQLRQLYQTDGYPIANPFSLVNSTNMDFFLYKPFYGRIDLYSDTVTNCSLNNNFINDAANIKSFSFDDGKKACNFTVDAFTEMRTAFNQKCANLAGLSTQGPLAGIEVSRGWESPVKNYSAHVDRIYKLFSEKSLNLQKINAIYDVKDFLRTLFDFVHSNLQNWPLTYGNYMISKFSPPHVSGLVIEVGNFDYGNDFQKTSDFIGDINFPTFVQHAQSYGFYIDRQAPWRLIQNLSSAYTLKYMQKYDVNSLEELFDKKFIKNYKIDIPLLRRELHRLYELFIEQNPNQVIIRNKNCPNIRELKPRPKLSFEQFLLLFPDRKMLVIYAYLRARELEINIPQGLFDNIVNEALILQNIKGMEKATESINDSFNFYKLTIIDPGYLTKKNSSAIDIAVEPKTRYQRVRITI